MFAALKKIVFILLKNHPKARMRARRLVWQRRGRRYAALTKDVQTAPKTAYFESFGGKFFNDSPKAVFTAMCADPRFDDWELIWAFKDPDAKSDPLLKSRATLVKWESEAHLKAYARAGYWFTCNRIFEYVYPDKSQVLVQCWHGTPLKRLAKDILIDTKAALNSRDELVWRYEIDASKWTYLVSPSDYTTEKLLSSFGLPPECRENLVLEIGYPRNDAIALDKDDETKRAAMRESLGIPPGKKILFFAPTWRDDNYNAALGYAQALNIDLDLLRAAVGEEWTVLIRAHYNATIEQALEPYAGFLTDVSGYEDINDLYLVSDALMTDYSSVFFDYANTGKPILFFWPDKQYYEDSVRGFYFDPGEIPGPKCETTEDVIAVLKGMDAWQDAHGEAYAQFQKMFCPQDDGHAAERLIQAVFH
jgi:CDP-glycerol glycerophosphotransferase